MAAPDGRMSTGGGGSPIALGQDSPSGAVRMAATPLLGRRRHRGLENPLPCALLHFISGAVRVSNDHKLRQPLKRTLSIFRNLNDPIGDRARFSGAR